MKAEQIHKENYDTSKLFKFPFLMACAGFGGCVAELFSIPFDTIKILKQTQNLNEVPRYKTTFQSLQLITREEGFRFLYTGLVPGVHRQMLYASIRIALFYRLKDVITEKFNFSSHSIAPRLISGLCAGSFAICFGNPAEVVKIRMQSDLKTSVDKRRYTKGTINAYRTVFNGPNGFLEFFRGLPMNMARNAIYNAAEVVTYDAVKEYIVGKNWLGDGMATRIIASTCAGTAAVAFGSPFDVMKARIIDNKDPSKGVLKIMSQTYGEKGIASFYQGGSVQLLRLVSFNVICFLAFEEAKDYLIANFPYALNSKASAHKIH